MKKQKVDLDKIYKQLLQTTSSKPPATVKSGYLSQAEATDLFSSLNGIAWDVLYNRYGLALLRKTKTYYEGDLTAATNYMNAYGDKGAKPIPFAQASQELRDLRKRLQQDYPGLPLSVCYVNYYYSGRAAIGWHQDREEHGCPYPLLMATAYGSGKGITRKFSILKMDGHIGKAAWEITTDHGDLIEMPIGFHDDYFHCVRNEKAFTRPRISLTFRSVDLSLDGKWRWHGTVPQVWDCHAGKSYPQDAVYVGCRVRKFHSSEVIREGTIFGNATNPLVSHHGALHTEAAFRAYAKKRMQDPAFAKQVAALRGKHLLCWCVQSGPKRQKFCHARVWLELVNPREPKERDWKSIEKFLTSKEADKLYKRMLNSLDWKSHKYDHPTDAFFIAYGKSYDKKTSGKSNKGGVKGEIPKIPDFLQDIGEKVSKEANAPFNYVQCHKYGPAVPVRPHHDPAGMIVPMLVVGQERTFRVGGEATQWAKNQIDRKVAWHIPAEERLLKHGSLLIFNGGKTMHSMYPATQDTQSKKNGCDCRISILFRWTTDIMREYGPGSAANAAGQQKQYDADVEKWRESGLKWDKPPKGIYFPGFLTPGETQALFDAYMKLRDPKGDKASRLNFQHFNDTGNARNKKVVATGELEQCKAVSKAPKVVRSLVAKLSKRFKRDVNYVSAVGYKDETHYMDYHNHKEDLGHDTPVFIVSTGATRTFGIRENATGKEIRFKAEPGSLIVLPNSYNLTHEHAVLKDKGKKEMRIALNMKAIDGKY